MLRTVLYCTCHPCTPCTPRSASARRSWGPSTGTSCSSSCSTVRFCTIGFNCIVYCKVVCAVFQIVEPARSSFLTLFPRYCWLILTQPPRKVSAIQRALIDESYLIGQQSFDLMECLRLLWTKLDKNETDDIAESSVFSQIFD